MQGVDKTEAQFVGQVIQYGRQSIVELMQVGPDHDVGIAADLERRAMKAQRKDGLASGA